MATDKPAASASEDYLGDFDTAAYLNIAWADTGVHLMQKWHDAACANSSRSHQRLLDIGTGPSIMSVASMSRLCDSITATDYVPSNRGALRKWILNELGAHDWTKVLQKIADLEGHGVTAGDITSRLRAIMDPNVLACDLHQENPLDPGVSEPFDLITSQLCLHTACRSEQEYQRVISRLGKMLKPGGAMFDVGSIGETFYTIGSTRFKSLPLTVDFVKKVYENAGFSSSDFQTHMFSTEELALFAPITDVKGFFLVSANMK